MFIYGENGILGYDADGFSIHELSRGRSPWHDNEEVYQELGRSTFAVVTEKEGEQVAQVMTTA